MRHLLLFLFLSLSLSLSLASADLRVGFYNSTCARAESIVHAVVRKHFISDPSITAAFLRMYFHDCFVTGCDGSILIDSTKKQQSEKAAVPNLTVRGFEIIDEAKSKVEARCPSTVSCADIIALATRDAVTLAGGRAYAVPTGKRDGLVSSAADVILPGPSFTIAQARQMFAAKGLTLNDMVILLGGHTVGAAHCGFIRNRLFDFQGTGEPDPTMDERTRAKLIKVCGTKQGELNKEPGVFLDQSTPFVVDNKYYKQILEHKGVLQIDQELALDNSTARIVAGLGSNRAKFLQKFGDAMVKLGRIQVLVGNTGEIRRKCSAFNAPH